jgi:hypothetical protein
MQQKFEHIYGPLNIDDVCLVELRIDVNGTSLPGSKDTAQAVVVFAENYSRPASPEYILNKCNDTGTNSRPRNIQKF